MKTDVKVSEVNLFWYLPCQEKKKKNRGLYFSAWSAIVLSPDDSIL